MLTSYFDELNDNLATYGWIGEVDILRFDLSETETKEILIYRLRAFLKNGDLLEMMERVVLPKGTVQPFSTKYSFHWQSENGKILRRWDNAPHHSEVSTHPYHIHVDTEETVIPSERTDAIEVLRFMDERMGRFPEK